MKSLLTPREVDLLFRYPPGRTQRLAKQGKIPCITLPDGQIRFDEAEVERLLATQRLNEGAPAHA